jgi:prepilin-type N-terminal cleavage/methylation domain-containing protein
VKRGGDSGFTLVEVLAALALAGVVSLILLHGIRMAVAGLDRLSSTAESLDQRRSLETALHRVLGSAVLLPLRDGGFDGKSDRIAFLTVAEDAGPGLYAVEIAVDSARADRPLVMSRRLARPPTAASRSESVLAHGVRRFRVDYFGAAVPGEEPVWTETWQGLGHLPRLVRITIDSGAAPPAPSILVRLWHAG